MYDIALAKGPVFDGRYVPYFYQSGKFLLYDIPHRGPTSAYFGTSTGYDFTSDIVPNISRQRGLTVEDIINNGYFPGFHFAGMAVVDMGLPAGSN